MLDVFTGFNHASSHSSVSFNQPSVGINHLQGKRTKVSQGVKGQRLNLFSLGAMRN